MPLQRTRMLPTWGQCSRSKRAIAAAPNKVDGGLSQYVRCHSWTGSRPGGTVCALCEWLIASSAAIAEKEAAAPDTPPGHCGAPGRRCAHKWGAALAKSTHRSPAAGERLGDSGASEDDVRGGWPSSGEAHASPLQYYPGGVMGRTQCHKLFVSPFVTVSLLDHVVLCRV